MIDVDDPLFLAPGDIPVRVQEYCRRTGQPVPQSIGEIMQCIYGSIALRYRYTFDHLKQITGKEYTCIHMVGGGIQAVSYTHLIHCSVGTDTRLRASGRRRRQTVPQGRVLPLESSAGLGCRRLLFHYMGWKSPP